MRNSSRQHSIATVYPYLIILNFATAGVVAVGNDQVSSSGVVQLIEEDVTADISGLALSSVLYFIGIMALLI